MSHQLRSNVFACVHSAKQHGFTLIELMIAVAIVGILASVAIPAYSDYIIRAKVTEAVTFADACKTSVYDYYATTDVWPSSATGTTCAGVRTPNVVSSVTVVNGAITVAIYGTRTHIGGSCNLILTPNADGSQWTGSTTCPKQYVPSNFR